MSTPPRRFDHSGLQILDQAGANGPVAFSDDLSRIAAVDTVVNQMTIYDCEVCG
ncbi:MAG: hypothetical protein QOH03_5254, partial [Kribbellaceae bacterium]|nr:hypothetical protein [Kribbellaceae bacterium]